jgi:hypothetical protein
VLERFPYAKHAARSRQENECDSDVEQTPAQTVNLPWLGVDLRRFGRLLRARNQASCENLQSIDKSWTFVLLDLDAPTPARFKPWQARPPKLWQAAPGSRR